MKTIVRISTRVILILLTLMTILGCQVESSNCGNLIAGYANNSDDSGYILVDTGQLVCIEYGDGHVTCTCSR